MKTIKEFVKNGYRRCTDACKAFWQDRRGSNTLEIVIIAAVLVAVALIFRTELMDFVQSLVSTVFDVKEEALGGLQ